MPRRPTLQGADDDRPDAPGGAPLNLFALHWLPHTEGDRTTHVRTLQEGAPQHPESPLGGDPRADHDHVGKWVKQILGARMLTKKKITSSHLPNTKRQDSWRVVGSLAQLNQSSV